MNVVTGGTGLLGSHLICQLLLAGQQVKALKRETSSLKQFEEVFCYYFPDTIGPEGSLQWVDGDITEIGGLWEFINAGDQVYHCAAEVHFNKGDNRRQFLVNVQGTANVVNVCIEKEVRKLVHVSSIGALGDTFNGQPVDEETPLKKSADQSAYSTSKYLGELEVFRGIAEGLSAVILNPSVIIGPGDTRSGMVTLMGMVRKGLKYYPSGSSAWVDVRDVATAIMWLMDNEQQGERFVISSQNCSYQYIMEEIAENLGVKPPVKRASKSLLKIAGIAGNIREKLGGKPNALTADLIRISSSETSYDPGKFIRTSGFRFIPVSQSLKDACSYLKGKGWL